MSVSHRQTKLLRPPVWAPTSSIKASNQTCVWWTGRCGNTFVHRPPCIIHLAVPPFCLSRHEIPIMNIPAWNISVTKQETHSPSHFLVSCQALCRLPACLTNSCRRKGMLPVTADVSQEVFLVGDARCPSFQPAHHCLDVHCCFFGLEPTANAFSLSLQRCGGPAEVLITQRAPTHK